MPIVFFLIMLFFNGTFCMECNNDRAIEELPDELFSDLIPDSAAAHPQEKVVEEESAQNNPIDYYCPICEKYITTLRDDFFQARLVSSTKAYHSVYKHFDRFHKPFLQETIFKYYFLDTITNQ